MANGALDMFQLRVIIISIPKVGLVSLAILLLLLLLPAMVTLGAMSFLGWMIDSLNWSGVRWSMQNCEDKAIPRVSSEDGMNLW